MERSSRFLQGIFGEGRVSYSTKEEREREEFKKEGLHPAQVPDVPDAVEVGDVVLFVHVLVAVLYISKTSSFMASVTDLLFGYHQVCHVS